MTHEVITITPENTFKDLTNLLQNNDVANTRGRRDRGTLFASC